MDNWMKETKGGPRTSVYTEKKRPKKKKTRLQKFKEGAADLKRRRIDEYTK